MPLSTTHGPLVPEQRSLLYNFILNPLKLKEDNDIVSILNIVINNVIYAKEMNVDCKTLNEIMEPFIDNLDDIKNQ